MSLKSLKTKRLLILGISGLFLIQAIIAPLSAHAQSSEASSINCGEFNDFTSRNDDRAFHNPCIGGGGACSAGAGSPSGPAPTSLVGESNPERVWNYFIARGLTPVAAAGSMGNIEKESGFNPWIVESTGVGFGLIQWSFERRTAVEAALRAAGITSYTDANEQEGLLIQLNYLWDEQTEAFTLLNAETTVEGNTAIASYNGRFSHQRAESQVGNGSTMLFHALIERSGDVPTEADRIGGYGVLTHRIDSAKKYLELYGGNSSAGGQCSVGQGGLTFDQAKALMDWYIEQGAGGGQLTISDVCNPWGTGFGECYAWASFISHYILGGACESNSWSAPGIAHSLINNASESNTKWQEVKEENLQPFTVISHGDMTGDQHVMVVLGIQDGEIIFTDLNVGSPLEDSDGRYIRGGTGGGNPGRVLRVKTLAETGFNFIPPTANGQSLPAMAAPVDGAKALSDMQAFMQEKGIN